MSGQASHRAHIATKAPRSRDFRRRNMGVLVVLGVVVAFVGPAAQANDGDPVLAGHLTDASSGTAVVTTAGNGFFASTSDPNPGRAGISGSAGAGTGVAGASSSGNGVSGVTDSDTASGVYGSNGAAGGGFGVTGQTLHGGIAVFANTPDGTGIALDTTGTIRFQNRSGTVRVASGHTSLKVGLAGVTAQSMVLATVQRAGGFFASAIPAAGSFTIYLNKAPVSPGAVRVAYLVLN
jgi:hypothetical protein